MRKTEIKNLTWNKESKGRIPKETAGGNTGVMNKEERSEIGE